MKRGAFLVVCAMLLGLAPAEAGELLPLAGMTVLPGWTKLYPSGLKRNGIADFVAIYGYAEAKETPKEKLDLYVKRSVGSATAKHLADMQDAKGRKYSVYAFPSIGMFFVYAMSEDGNRFVRFMLETNTQALADGNVAALAKVVKAYNGKVP